MSSQTIKHNKKRNTGLIYEMLVREISRAIIENDRSKIAMATSIIKRYFSNDRPLSRELDLFNSIVNSRNLKKESAKKVLSEVIEEASCMSQRLIDIKKNKLISEINKVFGKDFYSKYKIENYKILASLQVIFDSSRGKKRITESVSRVLIEEYIVDYLTSYDDEIKESSVKDIDNLTYNIVTKKFNNKYLKSLNESQKELLSKYTMSLITNEKKQFLSFLKEEKKKIVKSLNESLSSEEMSDNVMKYKMNEAIENINNINCEVMTDENINSFMLYYKLCEEVASK